MALELVKPTLDMEEAFLEYTAEWEAGSEPIVPYSSRLLDMSYTQWIEHTHRLERQGTCPPHLVPASTFVLLSGGGRILGAINIRHKLNDYLLQFGGHIGYGVRPSERRKGYATQMLRLALPIAKELGIERALITCDKRNTGSARTIQNNGGILENEVPEENKITQRYWIDLSK